ncbi:potassium channel family protein [Vibrio diabolicus]|uniref:potassium channel family protein n=1 Tax=Vibrio diabolicus TaxID=50719 RepID=UPI00228674DA|nr:potassium channel family protein [Vibrio diabolicus]MCZ0743185.1 potassium channel family protein [Vibrio diabolicus]
MRCSHLNAALEHIGRRNKTISVTKLIKEKTLEVWDWLSQVPSLIWGGGYFLCILVFAILFTITSDGFYHSTSQYESSLAMDAQAILESLEKELESQSNFEPHNYDGWTLDKNELSVSSLVNDEPKIKFLLHTVFRKGTDAVGITRELYFVYNPQLTSCKGNEDCYSTRILQSSVPIISKERKISELMMPFVAYYGDIYVIETSVNFDHKVDAYVSAKNGFPSEASGNFGRMLYLSIVTITTLGYGDIVPISDLNRFLVGLEAILGIILIGLFLNSLSQERRKVL